MRWIKVSISIIIAYIVGFISNTMFSSNHYIFENDLKIMEYKIPFIYTLELGEILFFLFLTFLIAMILIIYYRKSFLRKILNVFKKILWIEALFFAFAIGTLQWQFNTFYNEFLKIDKLMIWGFILTGYFLFSAIIEEYYERIFFEESIKKSDLYSSRENYLSIIDLYLNEMESFSVIGTWGTGKTKLIRNFFEKNCEKINGKYYKDKYEYIYIDSSVYSENQKIIETLEEELIKISKKYKTFKLKDNFIKKIFLQSETILKVVYNFFNFEISPVNETQILANEIKKNNKVLVVCLDNLERLGSRERITNLFAIIDELFSTDIKKIYIYDEKYMEKIFKKDEEDFLDYVSKYTFNTIELPGATFEEILDNNEKILNLVKDFYEKYKQIEKYIIEQLNSRYKEKKIKKTERDNIIKRVKKYLNQLEKLKNPRYLINLKEYITSLNKNYLEINYLFEYRLIKDIFYSLTLEEIEEGVKNYLEMKNNENDMSDKIIQKICVQYLFKLEKNQSGNYEEILDLKKKISFFRIIYNYKNIDENDLIKKLKEYKDNPSSNLLNILEYMMMLFPQNYVEKIKKYLEESSNNFILRNFHELYILTYLENFNEYFDLLFPKLQIIDEGYYQEDPKLRTLDDYLFLLKKSYFIYNLNIKYIISSYLSFEDYREYLSNAQLDNMESFLEKKFELSFEEFFNKIKEHFKKNQKKFNYIGIKNISIEKTLNVLEKITRIKKIKNKTTEIKKIDNRTLKYLSEYMTLEENQIIIENKYLKTKIIINDKNVKYYIEDLKLRKSERKDLEVNINFLLIQLTKFKIKK